MSRKKFCSLALALTLLFINASIIKVHGLSTIMQKYEESLYIEVRNQIYELVRCKIYVTIETEYDGTWRNDSFYRGSIIIVLDWYNRTLCPFGVTLLIFGPTMAYWNQPYIKQTIGGSYVPPHTVNKTLYSVFGVTGFDFTFKTFIPPYPQKISITMSPTMQYTVYNSTGLLNKIGEATWTLPDFWVTLTEEPQQPLQTGLSAVQSQLDSLRTELNNIENLMYVLILTMIILIVTTVYSAVKKPK